jgi:hypothetical protein
MTWSLRMDHEWVVRVAPLRNRQPAFGFLLQEADRQAGDEGGEVCTCLGLCGVQGLCSAGIQRMLCLRPVDVSQLPATSV